MRTSLLLAVLAAPALAQQDPVRVYGLGTSTCQTVAGLGDVDGDGFADVAVGIPTGADPRIVVLSTKDGGVLYTLPGPYGVGQTLAAVGDVDGDGLPDWVVGGSGPVTVYRGYDGLQLHSFLEPNGAYELALAGAGDVDADGHADIVIGAAHTWDGAEMLGAVWIYSGRTGGVLHKLWGMQHQGEFGYSVDGVGDVDGDGFGDFAVGAKDEDSPAGVQEAGVVRVYSGADATVLQTWSVDEAFGWFGFSVAGLGDVDGDGVPDLAAGGNNYHEPEWASGIVRVLSGGTGAVLHTYNGKKGQRLSRVAAAGDFDGDGFGDVALSKEEHGFVRVHSGRTGELLVKLNEGQNYGADFDGRLDLDEDGLTDLFVLRSYPCAVLAYLGHRGLVGEEYCTPGVANSTGQPAELFLSGSDVAGDLNLRVTVQAVPPGHVGLLLASQKTGFVPGAGGSQGNLCLKEPIARFVGKTVDSGHFGVFAWDVNLKSIPGHGAVSKGETWNFQGWYRDTNPGPTSNFSDAATVLFE